jgi:ADP-ribose pyrophosphatase YjhB (NUDIX family)
MWIGGVRVVIIDSAGKVLMVRQRHEDRDIWMLPGGAIEEGENSEQAAVREVKEETGLDVEVKRLLWHVEEVSEKRGQRFVNFFLAEVKGGKLRLGEDPEREKDEQVMEEIRYVNREEMGNIGDIYPAYLTDELWDILSDARHNFYKVR